MLNFNFFSKPKVSLVDFSKLGTDIHSHLVPGVDDGAQDIGQSIQLIRKIKELGFNKIVTTPHIMVDYYPNTTETIRRGLNILHRALKKQNVDIQIEAAAEYYLDEAFENKLDKKDILTMGKNYLLFELSYISCPLNLINIIEKILDKGYKPVMAHPERYPYFYEDPDSYSRIKNAGCLLQLNTISLTGYYGRSAQKVAEKLVDANMVDFIGSDIHHTKHAVALKESLQQPYVQKLLTKHTLINKLI